jgi:hypothetical protein
LYEISAIKINLLKSATAYYLLLLYLTILFKPLIPIIEDAWSHTFNRAEHLATVHAHQGKNHLHEALANSAVDLGGSKHQKSIQSESQVTVHIYTPAYRVTHHLNVIKNAYSSLQVYYFPSAYISVQGPPPKA